MARSWGVAAMVEAAPASRIRGSSAAARNGLSVPMDCNGTTTLYGLPELGRPSGFPVAQS
jgi:hypothetical protein